MDCPFCGAGTRVTRTITPDGGQRVIVRERQCSENGAHRFSTEEHDRIGLADVAVHQASGALVPYDRTALRDSIARALLVRETREGDRMIADIVDRVEERITRRGVGIKRLSDGERRQLQERARRADATSTTKGDALRALRVSIRDRDIEEAVDNELAQSDKTRGFRVMYALTVKGRQGSPTSHPGWKDADDFFRWVAEVIPDQSIEGLPQRVVTRAQTVPVASVRDVPKRVVGRDGALTDFDLERFMRGLGKACRGRRDENLKTRGVAWATLARLSGQQTVHSAQIASIALELLRATDEIAYLRAAVRFKQMTSVSDICAEASGLITHPSEHFAFAEPTASLIIPRPPG